MKIARTECRQIAIAVANIFFLSNFCSKIHFQTDDKLNDIMSQVEEGTKGAQARQTVRSVQLVFFLF